MACTVNPAQGPNTPRIPEGNETRGQPFMERGCDHLTVRRETQPFGEPLSMNGSLRDTSHGTSCFRASPGGTHGVRPPADRGLAFACTPGKRKHAPAPRAVEQELHRPPGQSVQRFGRRIVCGADSPRSGRPLSLARGAGERQTPVRRGGPKVVPEPLEFKAPTDLCPEVNHSWRGAHRTVAFHDELSGDRSPSP